MNDSKVQSVYESEDCEDYIDYSSQVLINILEQLPDNTNLYFGCYVDDLLKDSRLPKLFDYEVSITEYTDQFNKCFKLTSECKNYLKDNLARNYCGFFCHYMIMNGNRIYLLVYDSYNFFIDKSITVPKKLIEQCEKDEVYLTFCDSVTL